MTYMSINITFLLPLDFVSFSVFFFVDQKLFINSPVTSLYLKCKWLTVLFHFQGLSGLKGEKGKKGPRGENGPAGLQGPAGLPGTFGLKGSKGDRGNEGALNG